MRRRRTIRQHDGFTLIEAVVATLLVATGVAAVAGLSIIAARTNDRARIVSTATVLAHQKVEQLRALAFGIDADGTVLTDITTDTRTVPETPTGGTGLAPSPIGALSANVAGYCDFADASGRLLATESATTAPPGTSYVRRWSISPLLSSPSRSVVIQVLVLSTTSSFRGELTRVTDVRTRRVL